MRKARGKSRASIKNVWALKRRVSPVMGEIILELLYKSQGKKLPATEIASNKGIILEQISADSTDEKGWKKSRLPTVDLKKNNALSKSITIGKQWKIVPAPNSLSRGTTCSASTKSRRIPIFIESGLGFGSGKHETTQLCLELMERLAAKNSFLDVGTGSGILALAASTMGFTRVVGLDCDPNALRNARQNARLNQAESIRWKCGDLSKWKSPHKFQIVAANLLSSILIQQAPRLASWLQDGGFLIASGFFKKDISEIKAAFTEHRLTPINQVFRGRWSALLMKK
jgi:ribosomal protein L11 methyltransferase